MDKNLKSNKNAKTDQNSKSDKNSKPDKNRSYENNMDDDDNEKLTDSDSELGELPEEDPEEITDGNGNVSPAQLDSERVAFVTQTMNRRYRTYGIEGTNTPVDKETPKKLRKRKRPINGVARVLNLNSEERTPMHKRTRLAKKGQDPPEVCFFCKKVVSDEDYDFCSNHKTHKDCARRCQKKY